MEKITINGIEYKKGDKVEYVSTSGHLWERGFVCFGPFNAEIYTVYGFYVGDENGNQISEAGLHEGHTIIK